MGLSLNSSKLGSGSGVQTGKLGAGSGISAPPTPAPTPPIEAFAGFPLAFPFPLK